VQKERLQAEQELAKKAAQVQSFAKTLEQKSAILKDFETLQTTKRERERLEPDRDQYDQKQREVEKAEAELRIERTRLEGEVRVLKSQIAEVESKKRELENLLPQIERLEAELLGREAAGKALREAREEATRIEEQFAEMKSHNKQLKEKAVEYREAIEVLEQPLSACPVCDTALDEAKKSRVITRQKAHLDETQKALEQIKKEGNAVLEAQKAIQVRVQELEQKEKQFVQFSTQLQGLATRKAQLQKETTNSEALHANRTRIERELEQDAYSPGKHIALRNLKYHLQELKPKWEQYEVLTRTLRNLEGAETRHQNLLNTEANNTQALREQETLAAQKERYWRAEQEAEERYRKLLAEVQGLPALRQKSLEAERALSSVRDELGREKSNAHVAEVGLAQCSQDQQRYKTLEKEHEKQNQEAKYYNALASAFGRKGIQTMIIDNLLPEIQDDANELLGRMTDGEMKVSLTTTRDRKSGTGGAIETLDINITDGAGTRPYELFSGGEGFRVNFALRLSLSRLLARRSGARLETLIIDEGFGSQDGKGRERLVEVIEAVKEDFQKILVITHFEEMKDAFPQRIEIVKEANGSRIHLL
jgi:exonuclease SbcC